MFSSGPQVLNKENMSWPQNFVQSYVTHKTGKTGLLLRRPGESRDAHTDVCGSSEAGGETAAAEEKRRAEEGVRSSGGGGQEAQRHAEGKKRVQELQTELMTAQDRPLGSTLSSDRQTADF